MKKKIDSKWLINYIISFISIFLIEIVFKLISGNNIFNWSLFRIFISTSIIAIIVSFILSFVKDKVSEIVNVIISFILTFYAFAQLGFNNFIGVYMSFNTTSQLGAVVDYIKEYIASFRWIYYLIFIPFFLLVVYYIFAHKRIIVEKPKLKNDYNKKFNIMKTVRFVLCLTSLCLIYYSSLTIGFMQNKYQTQSNKDLFINPSIPSITVKQMGIVTFGLSDLRIKFFPVESNNYNYSFEKQEKQPTDYSRHIDDTAFENIILNEKNSTYNNLNKYFISKNITDKNDYTGLFEGKNVVVMMLESVNNIIINEEYYPNFYRLYNDGWNWENNYSPRNSCSTGNNELSGMVSLYSIYNSCTANIYKNNKYFEGIFNLFNNKGYYTTSMHDYTEGYYYRRTIHPNIGAQKYYGVEDLKIPYPLEYRNWTSDVDFMNSFLNILDSWDSETNFMTWLTTVSSHQPYTVSSVLGDKYLSMFEDTNYPTDLKRYMSKLKELDLALGVLLDGLEERGILEDTVIVLYGDHYPYGLSNKSLSYVLGEDLDDYEKERVPFVIYNSEIDSKTFTEYTSYINIVPTVANLFNLDFDPRYYMGTDLLSDEYESRVVFADGSWKNEHAYYNASSGNLKMDEEGYYSDEDITRINEDIDLKINMSSTAIKTNYFNYLNNALKKENERLEEINNIEEIIDEEPIIDTDNTLER